MFAFGFGNVNRQQQVRLISFTGRRRETSTVTISCWWALGSGSSQIGVLGQSDFCLVQERNISLFL